MIALAKLHAALDFVVETEQLLAGIRETSPAPQPGLTRVGQLLGEVRELLRRSLARQDNRHPVEMPVTRRQAGNI